jgi:hypothetical protein
MGQNGEDRRKKVALETIKYLHQARTIDWQRRSFNLFAQRAGHAVLRLARSDRLACSDQ